MDKEAVGEPVVEEVAETVAPGATSDELKATVDDLAGVVNELKETVQSIAAKVESIATPGPTIDESHVEPPNDGGEVRDSTPVRKPWTHRKIGR